MERNLIDLQDVQAHDWSNFVGTGLRPAGQLLKRSILALWRAQFITAHVAEVGESFLGDADELRVPVAQCDDCHFIVNVVELIRKQTGAMFDGSTLDQLQRKMHAAKLTCPQCNGPNLRDPVLGNGCAIGIFGGSLEGAQDSDGARIEDPTLYKVAPSSVAQQQMQLQDPFEELTGERRPDKPEKKPEPKKEEEEADKPEGPAVLEMPRIQLRPTLAANDAAYDLINRSPLVTHGVAHVGTVCHAQIGHVHGKDAIDDLYHARTPTEATVFYTQVEGDAECPYLFLTRNDQYIGNHKGSTTAPLPPMVKVVLRRCAVFLSELIVESCGIVFREALPCERDAATWFVTAALPVPDAPRRTLMECTHDTKGVRVTCYMEHLVAFALSAALTRTDDGARWMRFPFSVAPYPVGLAADNHVDELAAEIARIWHIEPARVAVFRDDSQANALGVPVVVHDGPKAWKHQIVAHFRGSKYQVKTTLGELHDLWLQGGPINVPF